VLRECSETNFFGSTRDTFCPRRRAAENRLDAAGPQACFAKPRDHVTRVRFLLAASAPERVGVRSSLDRIDQTGKSSRGTASMRARV
jgi:hypothetical protein